MLSMITHRKTLVKGHDPRNTALSIILSVLIVTFLSASFFLWAAVNNSGKTREDPNVEWSRICCFVFSAAFLLASLPPVMAYVGIEKRIPSLLLPMIVLVYVFSAVVHVGSIYGFIRMLYETNYSKVILLITFLLGLGLNAVFFFIGAINHCAFFHTYTFLKEPIRVSEQVDVEEVPVVSKFSQGI